MLDFISTSGFRENLGLAGESGEPLDIFNEMIRRLNAIEEQSNLLILDNVEDSIEAFRHRLPSPPKWHILLTSREEINGFRSIIRLDFLKPEDACLLFKKHYTRPDLTEGQIEELVTTVDYHTLTIEILAKTAMVQRYTFAQLKTALSEDARANIKIERPGSDKIERITSFLCSIFSMSQLSEDEIWVLQQMACLPIEYPPFALLHQMTVPADYGREEVFAETLHELSRKGWLLTNANSYKMHLVVSEVVKRQRTPVLKEVSSLLENVTSKLNIDQSKDNPIEKFLWVPFGMILIELAERQSVVGVDEANGIATLQNNLALVLQALGDYQGAKSLLEKALRSAEHNFGVDHPTTAIRYSNLATVLQALGDYQGALELSGKAVAIFEKTLPEKHPYIDTVKNIYNSIKQQIK